MYVKVYFSLVVKVVKCVSVSYVVWFYSYEVEGVRGNFFLRLKRVVESLCGRGVFVWMFGEDMG